MNQAARRAARVALVMLALAACGADPQPSSADAAVADPGGGLPDLPGLELGAADTGPADAPATPDPGVAGDPGGAPDGGPANTPPVFAPVPELTIRMGWSDTLALAPYLNDAEDPREALTLSWSSTFVGLELRGDPASPELYVVAPTSWFGQEVIELTATDTGGLTDTTLLAVIVTEVVPPPPGPEDKCGEVTLTLEAGTSAQEVLVSGTFNGWASTAAGAGVLTDADGDGGWELTLTLQPGTYHYKFIVDGAWQPDPVNPDKVDDGYGSFNSVLTIAPCDDPTPPPATCPTLFSYGPDAAASEVLLAGEFNGWGDSAATADALLDGDGDDVFEVTVDLAPGSYQYKLIVDGAWQTDPGNPTTVDDGSGNLNSLKEVPPCAP